MRIERMHSSRNEQNWRGYVLKWTFERLYASFELNGRSYKVEYEGLNLICFRCGQYGHRKEECPMIDEQVGESSGNTEKGQNTENQGIANEKDARFGPWMIVQRNTWEGDLYLLNSLSIMPRILTVLQVHVL